MRLTWRFLVPGHGKTLVMRNAAAPGNCARRAGMAIPANGAQAEMPVLLTKGLTMVAGRSISALVLLLIYR
jgi:hypothetical protein